MYCVSAQRAADQLKATNVSIISVGVGSEVDLNELRGLASRANDVFMVNNFDALDDIQEEVNDRTCEGRESSVSRCELSVSRCGSSVCSLSVNHSKITCLSVRSNRRAIELPMLLSDLLAMTVHLL